jgi:hypothetical protein
MSKRRNFIAISVIALSILVASPALASTVSNGKANYSATYFFGKNQNGQAYSKPAVIGKVNTINGDTITVTDKNGVAYAVDATNSQIKEGFNKTGTLADIKVGDTVLVQGNLSGSTTVAAATISDRSLMTSVAGLATSTSAFRKGRGHRAASSTAARIGNHAAVSASSNRVTGTLQSISGNSLSILTASSTTYTVDASSARIVLGGSAKLKTMATGTLASLQVGDKLMVMGVRDASSSATSFVANMIRDVSRTS